ncbi:hypothetical protein MHB54_00420 [Paenibacillus sp. FSL M7-0802]|uniref:hypothetical protein n=1 Tax=Paenibacillus sp. FSL M7-0802 TaxID=2921536 RepID=UPI0030FB8720
MRLKLEGREFVETAKEYFKNEYNSDLNGVSGNLGNDVLLEDFYKCVELDYSKPNNTLYNIKPCLEYTASDCNLRRKLRTGDIVGILDKHLKSIGVKRASMPSYVFVPDERSKFSFMNPCSFTSGVLSGIIHIEFDIKNLN